MKIAYLIFGIYNSGGMERVLCNKANYLADVTGYDVSIITTDQGGRPPFFDYSSKIRCYDLEIDYSRNTQTNVFRKTWTYLKKRAIHKRRLAELLDQERFDIVVSMFGPEIGWLPSMKDGSRKVAEIHFSRFFRMQQARAGLWKWADRIRDRAANKAVLKYDRFVVLTHEDKSDWGDKSNMEVIHNAASFIPERPALLTNKQAIAVGRLSHEKGYDRLIQAWRIVNRFYPDWKLSIFGQGEDMDKLIAQIRAADLQKVVFICAPTANIESEYQESSISVLSSRCEGLPMVLLEAMACGVPPVTFTFKCGPRDVIDAGKNGLLVEEGDVEGLAREIIRLIEDEALRHALGNAAAKTIRERFSDAVIMNQWVELFAKLKA